MNSNMPTNNATKKNKERKPKYKEESSEYTPLA